MTDPTHAPERGELLYLEDLEVGQRFTTAEYPLDEASIKAFALQFDPQPFHLDNDAAEKSFFGGLAASGWHTAAITMNLLVTSGPPLAWGVPGAGGEITWPRPVRPGDVLHVQAEIVEIRPSRSRPDRGIVLIRNETRNQNDDIVQLFTAKVIVPTRKST